MYGPEWFEELNAGSALKVLIAPVEYIIKPRGRSTKSKE
jgi:hypothetical protein